MHDSHNPCPVVGSGFELHRSPFLESSSSDLTGHGSCPKPGLLLETDHSDVLRHGWCNVTGGGPRQDREWAAAGHKSPDPVSVRTAFNNTNNNNTNNHNEQLISVIITNTNYDINS